MTKNTIEEQIHALGETKLTLDDRVAGVVADEGDGRKAGVAAEKQEARRVEEMFLGKIEEELRFKDKMLGV